MEDIHVIQLCYLFCTILSSLPAPLPQESLDNDEISDIILCCFVILQLLISIPSSTIFQHLTAPFPQSLLPQNRNSHPFVGFNAFGAFSRHEYLFWRLCGETPVTFNELADRVRQDVVAVRRDGRPRLIEGRPYTLDFKNRILLVLIWLRKYPSLDLLACMFDISMSTVSGTIHQVAPIIWHHFRSCVTWPSLREWQSLRNTWRHFPNAVGAIDGTYTPINRPTVNQRNYYSGHRHRHLMSIQVICDSLGHIRFIQAGFPGHLNDGGTYLRMPPIGPGLPLDFPPNCELLADKGYAARAPLRTMWRQVHLIRMPGRLQRAAYRQNRNHKRYRVKVEHVIKIIKDYRASRNIWRHPRWFQPVIFELCAFMAERHLRLFESL